MPTKKNIIPNFKKQVKKNARRLKLFINKLSTQNKKIVDKKIIETNTEVWKEVNCLSCSNCCRVMTPTFTKQDIKRIANHFKITAIKFKEKWLIKERNSGDWLNVKRPCQFLDLKTNYCTIYEIRPLDCAGFPHHNKKHLIDYSPMLKQNIDYCPATFSLIQKIYLNTKTNLNN